MDGLIARVRAAAAASEFNVSTTMSSLAELLREAYKSQRFSQEQLRAVKKAWDAAAASRKNTRSVVREIESVFGEPREAQDEELGAVEGDEEEEVGLAEAAESAEAAAAEAAAVEGEGEARPPSPAAPRLSQVELDLLSSARENLVVSSLDRFVVVSGDLRRKVEVPFSWWETRDCLSMLVVPLNRRGESPLFAVARNYRQRGSYAPQTMLYIIGAGWVSTDRVDKLARHQRHVVNLPPVRMLRCDVARQLLVIDHAGRLRHFSISPRPPSSWGAPAAPGDDFEAAETTGTALTGVRFLDAFMPSANWIVAIASPETALPANRVVMFRRPREDAAWAKASYETTTDADHLGLVGPQVFSVLHGSHLVALRCGDDCVEFAKAEMLPSVPRRTFQAHLGDPLLGHPVVVAHLGDGAAGTALVLQMDHADELRSSTLISTTAFWREATFGCRPPTVHPAHPSQVTAVMSDPDPPAPFAFAIEQAPAHEPHCLTLGTFGSPSPATLAISNLPEEGKLLIGSTYMRTAT